MQRMPQRGRSSSPAGSRLGQQATRADASMQEWCAARSNKRQKSALLDQANSKWCFRCPGAHRCEEVISERASRADRRHTPPDTCSSARLSPCCIVSSSALAHAHRDQRKSGGLFWCPRLPPHHRLLQRPPSKQASLEGLLLLTDLLVELVHVVRRVRADA